MEDCVFCKIVKGEIPATKVYEDDSIISFLDIYPANKGHTLVVTKEHFETLLDLPDELLAKLTDVTKKVAEGVVRGLRTDGFNILMNNKKVSGQLVPHTHFHIIPRFEGDGINLQWVHKQYVNNEMADFRERIVRNIKQF